MKKILVTLSICLILFSCAPIEDPVLNINAAQVLESESFEVKDCMMVHATKHSHADWGTESFDIKQAKIKIKNEANSKGGTNFVVTHIDKESVGSIVGRYAMVVYANIYDCNQKTDIPRVEEAKKTKPKNKKYDDKILLEISSGTGFFISKDGYLITNNHVVEICKEIRTIKDHTVYKVNILATDQVNDLAIGKIEQNTPNYLSLSSEGAVLGEDIIVSGYPLQKILSESVKITKGVVSSLSGPGNNYSIVQIDAAVQAGNSGGPILNNNAKVIGVTVAKADALYFIEKTGTLPENVNFGIKVEAVKSFVKGNNVQLTKTELFESKELSSAEISAIAAKGTIHLQCWNTMAGAVQASKLSKARNILVNTE